MFHEDSFDTRSYDDRSWLFGAIDSFSAVIAGVVPSIQFNATSIVGTIGELLASTQAVVASFEAGLSRVKRGVIFVTSTLLESYVTKKPSESQVNKRV